MTEHKFSPRLILAVVSFGVFVAADDLTVVSTMLRQIIFDLEIPLPDGLDRAAWIVNAYLIGYVVVMPFAGRLSDIFGRRLVFLGAYLLFLVGSIWVPFASNLDSFIAGRVLTALGGGTMVPVAMAAIGDAYREEKRASAMGTLGAIDTAGWVWGPFYGALLINFLDWRWQFYLNIPLALIGMVATWRVLAKLPPPAGRARIDWLGAGALTVCLISLNVALLTGANLQSAGGFAELDNPTARSNWSWYLVSAVALGLFLYIQRALGRQRSDVGRRPSESFDPFRPFLRPAPLIDLGLFRIRNFSAAVLVNFLVGAVLIIAMVNVPLVVNVLEFDAQTAALMSGYLLSGMTAAMAVAAFVGGRLTERFGYRPVVVIGLAVCSLAFGVMGQRWMIDAVRSEMAWHLVLLGIGFGLVTAPIATAVINAAGSMQRGVAASLVVVFRLIGMSVGLSGLTAWGLRRFGELRTGIELPDLPLSDPAYQQAVVEGLTRLTIKVLAETFLISAAVALLAMFVGLRLRRGQRGSVPNGQGEAV